MIELSETARDALEAIGRRPVLADSLNPKIVEKLVKEGFARRIPREGSDEEALEITFDGREWMTEWRRAQRRPARPT